jgi:hypothetical protein
MDAVSALLNYANDLAEAHFAGVIDFERTASREAHKVDREDNGFKCRFVRVVEWTIDENVFPTQTRLHASISFEPLAEHT